MPDAQIIPFPTPAEREQRLTVAPNPFDGWTATEIAEWLNSHS
jgi:hypothetical protein